MPTKSAAGLIDALKLLAVMPIAGAGVGGLVGAARAEKGKRLRTALGDAGVGALAGLGFGVGGTAGSAAGAALSGNAHPIVADQNSASLGGLGAGLGAIGAGVLGQKIREDMEDEYDRTQSPLAAMTKINSDLTTKNAESNIEKLLFKNPFVARAGNFGDWPRGADLPQGSTGLPASLPLWMLTGAGAGSLIGAARAEKGKRLRGAALGGTTGALAGLFGSVGADAAAKIGDVEMAYHGKPHTEFSTPARVATVAAPYALGGASALLGGKLLAGPIERSYDDAVRKGEEVSNQYKKKDTTKKEKTMKKKSADIGMQDPKYDRAAIAAMPYISGLYGAGIGGAAGGLYGLATGKKGKRLQSVLRGLGGGALIGGGTGLGAGYMASRAFPEAKQPDFMAGLRVMAARPEDQEALAHKEIYGVTEPELKKRVGESALLGGATGLGLGGLGATGLMAATADRDNDEDAPVQKKKKTEKKSAALQFGEKVAEGFNWQNIMNTGLGSAAVGAGLGGLYGLVAPGEDEEGRPRSRIGSALRNALGGGLLFGAGGAAGEAMSPGIGQKAYDYAQQLYQQMAGPKKQPRQPDMQPLVNRAGNVQTPDEYRSMLKNNPFYKQTGRMNMPNNLSGNYLPDYGARGGRIGPVQS